MSKGGHDLLVSQWQISDVTAPLAGESRGQYLCDHAADEEDESSD